MKLFIILSFLISLIRISFSNDDEPIVVLENGAKIKGFISKTENETKIHQFRAIRYARAQRFEKPVLETLTSDDIYDATGQGHNCWQFLNDVKLSGKQFVESENEDCLFLNVFKKAEQSNELLPVMVWIHGGGFQSGSGLWPIHDGSMISGYGNVIVVTINYRLGIFGYLYAGNDDAPGNQGFYDQVMALKWIQSNIKQFGGDPNKITIFGNSAGAFSVSALIVSPLAKGLFHRAIVQSGSIAPIIKFCGHECSMKKTMDFAKKLNCDNEDVKKMIKCLKEKNVQDIVTAGTVDAKQMFADAIGPVTGDEFLPTQSLSFDGHLNEVDLIYGVVHDEGSMFLPAFLPKLNDDNSEFTMEEVKQTLAAFSKSFNWVDEKLIEKYIKDLDVSDINQVRKVLNDFLSDSIFNCPTFLFGRELASKTKKQIFSYRFDHRSFLVAKLMNCEEWMNVCHSMDIVFTFGNAALVHFPAEYQLFGDMMQAWTNFARDGHPKSFGSVEWKPAFGDEDAKNNGPVNTMIIDVTDQIKMIKEPFSDVCEKHWKKLYQSYQSLSHKQEL